VDSEEFSKEIGKPQHNLNFTLEKEIIFKDVPTLQNQLAGGGFETKLIEEIVLNLLQENLETWIGELVPILRKDASLHIRSVEIKLENISAASCQALISWSYTVCVPLNHFFFFAFAFLFSLFL